MDEQYEYVSKTILQDMFVDKKLLTTNPSPHQNVSICLSIDHLGTPQPRHKPNYRINDYI